MVRDHLHRDSWCVVAGLSRGGAPGGWHSQWGKHLSRSPLGSQLPGGPPPVRCAREKYLVVAQLLDGVHERPDRLKEAAELRALAEAVHVSLFRLPLDANDLLGRILGA